MIAGIVKQFSTGAIEDDRNIRKLLWLACAALFVAHLALCVTNHQPAVSAEDYQIASNLVAGNGYSQDGIQPTAIKVPVFPLILSVLIALFGTSNVLAIQIFQSALMSLVPIVLYNIGSELGYKRVGLLAAFVFLLHPSYLYYPLRIEVTNLAVPLSAAWTWMFIRTFRDAKRVSIALYGLASGLLILTQPMMGLLILASLIFFAIRRRNVGHLAIVATLIGLVMTPWVARNYVVFHEIIPTKSCFWINIYSGFFPKEFAENISTAVPDDDPMKRFYVIDPQLAGDIFKERQGKSGEAMEPTYRAVTLETIRNHPISYVAKTIVQLGLFFWVPPSYLNDNSPAVWVVRKAPVMLIDILSVIGLALLARRDRALAIALALILLSYGSLYAVSVVHFIRYKLDIEWLQLFPVAVALENLLWRLGLLMAREDAPKRKALVAS